MRACMVRAAFLTFMAIAPPSARAADTADGAMVATLDEDGSRLEQSHVGALRSRRALAWAVTSAGIVSLAGGAVLLIPDGADQAYRCAGANTAMFGAVNLVVGLLALRGIGREERDWNAGREARRTPAGLRRAQLHVLEDERRESASQALNLGLDIAYASAAGTAILASQLGASHSDRWLASGVAIGIQALVLTVVDVVGLVQSSRVHARLLMQLAPTVAVAPQGVTLGWAGAF